MVTKSSTRKAPAAPRLTRLQRAQQLMATGGVHPTGQPGRYTVRGSKPDTTYRVEVHPKGWVFCTCVDWQRQADRVGHDAAMCYHAQAVILYREAIRAAFRPVPALVIDAETHVRLNLPGEPLGYCSVCGYDTPGASRCTGGHRNRPTFPVRAQAVA